MTLPPPVYGPPGYPPPPPPPGDWQAPRPTSGKAIASLICAIGGAILSWMCPVVGVACLIGLVLGVIAIVETGRNGTRSGRGLAIAGTIVSGLAIAGSIAVIVAFVALARTGAEEEETSREERIAEDARLIIRRVQEYYRGNDHSLGPGGPVVTPSTSSHGANDLSAPASDSKVVGGLTVEHLVSDSELKWSIDFWSLAVTDRAKATLSVRDWSGETIREYHITDAGTGAYFESAGSSIR